MCNYCGYSGHTSDECNIKKRDDEKSLSTEPTGENVESNNISLMVADLPKQNNTLWVADSGATAHMSNNLAGVNNYIESKENEHVKVGDGHQLKITGIGDYIGKFKDKDGKEISLTLSNVKIIPELNNNLIRITKVLASGGSITNIGEYIMLKVGEKTIMFNARVTAGDGYLNGIILEASNSKLLTDYSLAVTQDKFDINTYHQLLGHPCEKYTRMTDENQNITLTGEFKSCISCSLGNIKKTRINKINPNKSDICGERLYFDLIYIESSSLGGNKYWMFIEDEETAFNITCFLPLKSELAMEMCGIIKTLVSQRKNVKYFRCDNAGENFMVQEELVNNGTKNIEVEHTAPRTPQQNGVVERKFATLYNKVICMFNLAGIHAHLRKRLWAECCNCSVFLNNRTVFEGNTQTPHQKFTGSNGSFIDKRFGPDCAMSPRSRLTKTALTSLTINKHN